MLCRVRESAGAIYRFRVRAILEDAVGVSLSEFGLKDHCKACVGFDMAQRWRWDMGT